MKTFPTRIAPLLLSLLLFSSLAEAQQLYDYTTESEVVVPKGRELFFYGMRSYPFGKIPQGARQKAFGQMEKMSRFSDGVSTLADASWKQLGPMTVGGRVRSIAVHPTDGKTLWIGAADGGVWKSTDRGNSWRPLTDNMNAIALGAVAVAPSSPNILYAGTGEMSSNVDAYTGAGIFKSEDGGETWHVVGLTNVGAFSRIVVHPTNANIVWAGATKNNDGFYKSEDGGATWRQTLNDAISDITLNPNNPNELWVALMGTGIRYSNDGGETFTTRNNGIADSRYVLNRMSIQVAPSNPSILYALSHEATGTTSSSLEYARIYKTTNGGQNWTKVYDGTGGSDFLKPSATSRSQGWYNNVLIVKPDNPNVVLAGGVRMIRTSNGGDTWPSIGGNVHPDHHAMAFDPVNPNVLYNGNDGGMYRSDDGGASLGSINNGLPISQFYAMAVDQRVPNLTYGGTQDNGTLTTESESFGDVFGGDGFYVAVDHNDPNVVYVEREYGQMYRLDQFGTTAMYLTGDFSANSDVANWSAPLVLDPHNSDRLYSGRDSLYVCVNPKDDRGALQWLVVSPYMPGNISAMIVSPHTPDVIFIGSARGAVQRTTNGLQDWTDLSFGHGLPNRAVTDFVFSREDPNTLYASYSGFYTDHIFKSTDLGESWTSISNGLPDIPINALEIHPDDEEIIFAGSDLGMFITLDGGESWAVYNEGMPRVGVIDLAIHLQSRTLRAATHGRSMFERGVGGDPIQVAPSITSPHGGENWNGGTQNVIAWGGFDGSGDPSGVTLEFSLDDGKNWRLLGKNIGGTTFRWNTVQANTITARVRVTGYTSLSETPVTVVSNTFSIRPFSQGTVLTTDSKPTVPYGIASDGEYLWATDFQGNTLLKLDRNTLDAVELVHLDPRAGDSLFTDITYYPPRNSFFLHRLNSTTFASAGGKLIEVNKQGEVLGVWNSPCGYPIGLAWLGEKNPELDLLVASDRDGAQNFYYYQPASFDPNSSEAPPIVTIERVKIIENGPRGMTADSGTFWQVITDFTGGTLQGTQSNEYDIRDDAQKIICGLELASPLSNTINARGIEIDTRDRGLWITDFNGNIYKVASCYTQPGASDSGTAVNLSVEAGPAIAEGVMLQQNLPNPFANTTEIKFTLPKPMRAQLLVHDMSGRLIATVADKVFQSGEQTVEFQPKGIPSGLYRYSLVLESGGTISKTMVYLK